jgi:hypothetical protein
MDGVALLYVSFVVGSDSALLKVTRAAKRVITKADCDKTCRSQTQQSSAASRQPGTVETGFDTGPLHVGFMVDRVALGQVFV